MVDSTDCAAGVPGPNANIGQSRPAGSRRFLTVSSPWPDRHPEPLLFVLMARPLLGDVSVRMARTCVCPRPTFSSPSTRPRRLRPFRAPSTGRQPPRATRAAAEASRRRVTSRRRASLRPYCSGGPDPAHRRHRRRLHPRRGTRRLRGYRDCVIGQPDRLRGRMGRLRPLRHPSAVEGRPLFRTTR